MKRFKWEQDQIKQMKEYVARFGHGTAKLARQAQSKEKTLEKMVRGGLTEKVALEGWGTGDGGRTCIPYVYSYALVDAIVRVLLGVG